MQSEGLGSARLLEGNGLVLAEGLPKDCAGGASGHLGMGGQRDHTHHTSGLWGKWERLYSFYWKCPWKGVRPCQGRKLVYKQPLIMPLLLQVHLAHLGALLGGDCSCVWSQPDLAPLKHPTVPMCPTAEQTKGLGLLVPLLSACKADTVTFPACGAWEGMAAVKVSVMIQNQGSFGGGIAVVNLQQSEAIQGCSQAT